MSKVKHVDISFFLRVIVEHTTVFSFRYAFMAWTDQRIPHMPCLM